MAGKKGMPGEVQMTFSGTDIVDTNFVGACLVKGFYMSINQISDINIISYTSSISCGIVCSFNLLMREQKTQRSIVSGIFFSFFYQKKRHCGFIALYLQPRNDS